MEKVLENVGTPTPSMLSLAYDALQESYEARGGDTTIGAVVEFCQWAAPGPDLLDKGGVSSPLQVRGCNGKGLCICIYIYSLL